MIIEGGKSDVRAEYVPILIKGLLAEWFADYGLKLSVEAQEQAPVLMNRED